VFAGTGTAGELHKKDPVHPTTPGLLHTTCSNDYAHLARKSCARSNWRKGFPRERRLQKKSVVGYKRVQGEGKAKKAPKSCAKAARHVRWCLARSCNTLL